MFCGTSDILRHPRKHSGGPPEDFGGPRNDSGPPPATAGVPEKLSGAPPEHFGATPEKFWATGKDSGPPPAPCVVPRKHSGGTEKAGRRAALGLPVTGRVSFRVLGQGREEIRDVAVEGGRQPFEQIAGDVLVAVFNAVDSGTGTTDPLAERFIGARAAFSFREEGEPLT